MDYRKIGDVYYVRLDRGDEIIGSLIDICKSCKVESAIFSGIGGCGAAEIGTFIPETGTFETTVLTGMLELISLSGNIISDPSGEYFHHTHGMFSYKENGEHRMLGGHMQSITVLYTAEIELRPVMGGAIRRSYDPETGTGFWAFQD